MRININGKEHIIDNQSSPTIAVLLADLGLQGKPTAVEVNRQLIPSAGHEQTELHEGDSIELVTLVGGG